MLKKVNKLWIITNICGCHTYCSQSAPAAGPGQTHTAWASPSSHTDSFSSGMSEWISCRRLFCCCRCCRLNTRCVYNVHPRQRSETRLENPTLKCFWVKRKWPCANGTKAPNLWAGEKIAKQKGKKVIDGEIFFQFYWLIYWSRLSVPHWGHLTFFWHDRWIHHRFSHYSSIDFVISNYRKYSFTIFKCLCK